MYIFSPVCFYTDGKIYRQNKLFFRNLLVSIDFSVSNVDLSV